MPEDKKSNSTVTVHNKISANFREIHVDGAYGGITPQGLLNLNFFAERTPIPKSSIFEVTEEQKMGRLLKNSEDSKTGILREFEFGIYMNVQIAKSVVELLSQKIAEYEKIIENIQPPQDV